MSARPYFLTLLAALSCSAIAQPKANPAMPCYQALAGDPQFAAIKDKVALGGTVEEMRRKTASADRASPQERPVLDAWRSAREMCHRQELPYYATRDVEIQALAREHFAAVQALIAELQSGAISYGDFGKRRVALHEKVNADIERVRQAILPPKPVPHGIEKK